MAERTTNGVKRFLFAMTIPLIWALVIVLLELVLAVADVGYSSRLFVSPDPALLVDNPEYVRRFYPVADPPPYTEKSNLLDVEKAPGWKRIFVVGGSTAQGFPYKRNHSFTAIAESALQAAGLEVEIVNLGNSAMSSYYVREVLKELPRYEPDMVVVYAGHNEYYGTPSSFSGGTDLTRRALLQLKKLRSVQLMGSLIRELSGGSDENEASLMQRRFDEGVFPQDATRDSAVAALLIGNLDAGVQPLLEDGVPVSVFEPVSHLVGMPPFRGLPSDSAGGDRAGPSEEANAGAAQVDPVELYRAAQRQLEAGQWDRRSWEAARDADLVPFRARTTLVERLRSYVQAEEPRLRWIATADEMEEVAGAEAFTRRYFIDHLHFNFEGQRLLARLLADAVIAELYPDRAGVDETVTAYLDDIARVREGIYLTPFWEFDAYTRVLTLFEQEPYRSMPIELETLKYPAYVASDPLFQTPDFVAQLQGEQISDFFYIALDEYRRLGYQDDWQRNMNSFIHIFPGEHETHLAYGMAMLEANPRDYLEPAGGYFRRAYLLSGRDPEVRELVREALFAQGVGPAWDAFQLRYLY